MFFYKHLIRLVPSSSSVAVYKPLPATVTDEEKVLAQIHRMVKMQVQPITGIASQYDYDKKEWKPRN